MVNLIFCKTEIFGQPKKKNQLQIYRKFKNKSSAKVKTKRFVVMQNASDNHFYFLANVNINSSSRRKTFHQKSV